MPFFALTMHKPASNWTLILLLAVALVGCSDDKPTNEVKFKPIPEKRTTTPQEEESFSRKVEAVLNEGAQSAEGEEQAPRASKARPPNSGKDPMIRMTKEGMPLGEVVYHNDKLDYYECTGLVAPWFLELVVAEMNYFNELAELPFVDPKTCILTYGTDKSLTPGRIGIQLYENSRQFERCIKNEECPVFRTVNFVPNRTAIMRSYFLSDFSKRLIQHHCVTDTGKWHRGQTCYTVENP
jgi:hypothetical protein